MTLSTGLLPIADDTRDDPTWTQLHQARTARIEQRYADARRIVSAVLSSVLSPDQHRFASAECARLAYYEGHFAMGLESAIGVIKSGDDVIGASARIAAAANLLALNRGVEARRSAEEGLLRLRLAPADATEQADAHILLAHIHAHMGHPVDSIAAARAAIRCADHPDVPDIERARSAYALGFSLAYAGRSEALDQLLKAERMLRPRGGPLWNWLVFCIAVCLRDRGVLTGAREFLARSALPLRYERAWFEHRGGTTKDVAAWLGLPISQDEIPFVRVLTAVLRKADRKKAYRSATRAAEQFATGGLDYWRWGALWLAADLAPSVDERTDIGTGLVDELEGREAAHWGFFDPAVSTRVLRHLCAVTPRPSVRRLLERTRSGAEPMMGSGAHELLLASLHLLNPEAIPTLLENGLSLAEVRTVVTALDLWLREGVVGRRAVATTLRRQDSTVRSLMRVVRAKLGIERRRGIGPILAWLAERELLAPSVASRALAQFLQ